MDNFIGLLFKYGIDIKEEVNRPDFQGRSALHLAASSGTIFNAVWDLISVKLSRQINM